MNTRTEKAKELLREIAGCLYLFTSLMCIMFIARRFLVEHDLEVFARIIEAFKHDPLVLLKGVDFVSPEDFVNLIKHLLCL